MNRPDFIVIGAMKCATTTLHDQLALQPGVFMSTPKEPNFFSDDAVYQLGTGWYSALFDAAPAGALKGESSTHYTKLPTHPKTIERLMAYCPDIKAIYVMRHPIDRLVSQYIHEWSQRLVSDPIDRAIDTFEPLMAYSRYAMQLEPWRQALGPERILPVIHERLVKQGQAELERVAAFLGINGPIQWQEERQRSNVSAQRLRKSGWRDRLVYAPGISFIRRHFVPQSLRDRVKGLWQMRARPEISPDSLARLKRVLDEDLARLGDWLGVPGLSCDTFDRLTQGPAPAWRRRERA